VRILEKKVKREYKKQKYHKQREKKEEKNIGKTNELFLKPRSQAALLKPNFFGEKLEKRFVFYCSSCLLWGVVLVRYNKRRKGKK